MKTPRFMKMLPASAALVLVLSSCGSDDPSPVKTNLATDIYVAGQFNTLTAPQYNWVPAYWKNGELVQLEEENGEAKAMAVVGDDVFVIGKLDSNDDELVLWTNGEKSKLTNTTEYTVQYEYVYGMKVFGDDWYAWGSAYTTEFGDRAAYWKNGDIHIIETTRDSRAYDLTVDGGHVYVAGHEGHESGYNIATVWQDDVGTPLTDGSSYVSGIGVAVSNGHVYVSAVEGENVLLWKDAESVEIENIKGGAYASLVVINDDVYISGYANGGSGNQAHLWKNGIEIDLDIPETVTETYGSSMLAVGNDVFMLGEAKLNGSTEYTTLVWKNGELTDAFDGTVLAQHAYSLLVK